LQREGLSHSAERELAVWKRVIKGAFGSIVYATLEKVVTRELDKEERRQ
jgi:hypothetical protein